MYKSKKWDIILKARKNKNYLKYPPTYAGDWVFEGSGPELLTPPDSSPIPVELPLELPLFPFGLLFFLGLSG